MRTPPKTNARSLHPEEETPEHHGRDGCARSGGQPIRQPDSFDALYESMERCRKNVMWKDSVSSYCLNAVEKTLQLESDLSSGRYRPYPPRQFTITHPKRREIISIAFRDRIWQRSLNDNCIYPQMSRSFIYDNCACQKGKGTDFARNRLKCFLQRHYRKHGTDGYVLQCDIKGYYPNMRHDVAKAAFRKRLDPYTFRHAEKVLDGQYAGEVGFNAGSQMIQIAGISVLDGLDHMVKDVLGVRHYLRYMDDFILISHDRCELETALENISFMLKTLGFELHPHKTRIYGISDGIPFLGFKFMLTETGKVLMVLKPSNIKAERRKLKRLVRLSKNGLRTREKIDECYQGWRAHAMKGDNHRAIERMDAFYKSLWKETI